MRKLFTYFEGADLGVPHKGEAGVLLQLLRLGQVKRPTEVGVDCRHRYSV